MQEGNTMTEKQFQYQLWNRLIGITNPERLGDADDA
jgi:hypothetical protein